MTLAAAESALDLVMPHAWAAIVTTVLVPVVLYMVGIRFQWRRDWREEGQTVGDLMAKLSRMQNDELVRLSEEGKALSQQIELLSAGRLRLQAQVEAMRDEIIAGRVLIHDYERRLGLQETIFPTLPIPTLTDARLVS